MANFLNQLGNQGIAEVVGKKAGEVVENTVKSVLGKSEENKEEGKSGGFDAGDVLSLVGGKKDDNKGGFDAGDVLSLVGGGSKGEEGGGLDVKNVVGGLFK